MQASSKTSKSWLFFSLFFIVSSTSVFAQSKGIWKGTKVTFSKSSSSDWTQASNQDRITDSVWITRKNTQGIFNIKIESGYSYTTSPKGTKWAYGTTSNIGSLTFRDWETAVGYNPPGSVNRDMVMFIVKDSIYIDIKFTSWASGGSGGGFTYVRATDCRSFSSVKAAMCDSFVSPSKKYVWKKSGTYYDTLTNGNSCDSIMTIKLTIYGQDTGKVFRSGCGSLILPFSKRKVTATGIYYDTLVKGTICGRDSILVSNIYIYPVPTINLTVAQCDSFVSPSGDYVWKKSGKYIDRLEAVGTCDTIINIDLTINTTHTVQAQAVSCDSFVSAGNRIYRKSGNFLDTLQASGGCDSVIDLDLTINKSILTKISPFQCTFSYESPSKKYTWRASGTYYDTLTRTSGCDSVIEVKLNIVPWQTSIEVESCTPWTSPSAKYVYDKTGIYHDTLTTTSLCDSVVTVEYTQLESTTVSNTILAAINRYHAPSGKYVWTTSGIYKDTIPNRAGCDSIMTFDLTVKSFSLDVTKNGTDLTAVATGVNYVWLNCDNFNLPVGGQTAQTYSVTKNGRYSVELSNEWNKDTSNCVAVSLGLDKIQNPYGILVYPNPNNGRFTLDLGQVSQESVTVQVYNANGKMLYTQAADAKLLDINILDKAASGVYFVRVLGKDFSYNTSVVIR